MYKGIYISSLTLFSQNEVNTLSNAINDAIRQVIAIHSASPDFLEHSSKTSRWKEVVRHCFKLGFDFDREVLRLVSGKPNPEMAKNVVQLAYLWIEFVLEHSERGRGLRPKWATRVINLKPYAFWVFSVFFCSLGIGFSFDCVRVGDN